MSVIALLLSAGRSRRYGSDKLFEKTGEKTVFEHSLEFLNNAPQVEKIFIVANTKNRRRITKIIALGQYKKVAGILLGGSTRFESVKKSLHHIGASASSFSFFVIHNAANPFATQRELKSCFAVLKKSTVGVAPGRPVISTLKIAPGGNVQKTLSRDDLWEMETPQVVRITEFLQAMRAATKRKNHALFTDDLSVLEAAGFSTAIIPASPRNRKITVPENLSGPEIVSVGIGEDAHMFIKLGRGVKGRRTQVLGGVKISGMPSMEAESDGDVILHALCNAISSALGGGSLGTYATSMCYRGIRDSREYLKKNLREMERAHRAMLHCSLAIEAARPRIDSLVPRIKKSLCRLLKITPDNIGITATTAAGVTSFGQGLGIRCQAIVALRGV